MQVPFGPGRPQAPVSIDPLEERMRPRPRRFEYPISWNLPGLGQPFVPWQVLRQAAERIDLFRACIEVRKAQIVSLEWDITLSDDACAGPRRAGSTLSWEGYSDSTPDRLTYLPRTRRVYTPFGLSNVEQALAMGDLYLKRIEWMRAEFAEGTVPEAFIGSDATMTPELLKGFQEVLNDELAGQSAERKRLRLLPHGFTVEQMHNWAEKFKPDYDAFLINMGCLAFHVM